MLGCAGTPLRNLLTSHQYMEVSLSVVRSKIFQLIMQSLIINFDTDTPLPHSEGAFLFTDKTLMLSGLMNIEGRTLVISQGSYAEPIF